MNISNEVSSEICSEVAITASAIERIISVCNRKDTELGSKTHHFLRFSVNSGGCYGFSYIFKFESELKPDDLVIKNEQGRVVVALSPKIIKFAKGAVLDFVEEIASSYFTVVSNPNSAGGCGCGNSFSLAGVE